MEDTSQALVAIGKKLQFDTAKEVLMIKGVMRKHHAIILPNFL